VGLKLMCVVAHPDDECFGFGGALALAADGGVEVYVVCLTDGKAASARGGAETGEELGRMRRGEFAAACKVLGVRHSEVLDYEDGRLEFVDFARTAGRLVERMRRFRPDVVVTFGGDGGLNTHADHMLVSALTTAAFHWSGRERRYPELAQVFQPRRLFYLSTNFFMEDRQAPLPAPWTLQLDVRGVLERKLEAFREHTSQAPLVEQTKEMFARHGASEFYTLAAGAEAGAARLETGMFAGL